MLPSQRSGFHALIRNKAASSTRQATRAAQSPDLEPSNASVIRSLGFKETSDCTASHSYGAIHESSEAFTWFRYIRRDSEMTLERFRIAATVPSMSNQGESPRAFRQPSFSFSRPFSKPCGSSFGFGISLIGVSAGASSESYSEPTSIASPARTFL